MMMDLTTVLLRGSFFGKVPDFHSDRAFSSDGSRLRL